MEGRFWGTLADATLTESGESGESAREFRDVFDYHYGDSEENLGNGLNGGIFCLENQYNMISTLT